MLTVENINFIRDTDERTKDNRKLSLYRCECGKEFLAQSRFVRCGRIISCGCRQLANRYKRKHYCDLRGKTFGRWSVLREDGLSPHGNVIWLVICQKCLTKKSLSSTVLKRGLSRSCGCYRKESLRRRARSIYG